MVIYQKDSWLKTLFSSFMSGMDRVLEVVFVGELWERIKVASVTLQSMKIEPDPSQSC